MYFNFFIKSFLYSKSKISLLKFLKLNDSSVNNKWIECLKTLSNFELYWSAINDFNKSNNSSVDATISSLLLINKSMLSKLLLKSITFPIPPISCSSTACGSITTTLYFCLRLSFLLILLINKLINLDLPHPEEPIMIECLSKLKLF